MRRVTITGYHISGCCGIASRWRLRVSESIITGMACMLLTAKPTDLSMYVHGYPDGAVTQVCRALQTAALRGVDVRLLLPGGSDHPLVHHAGRSFLDELLAAGVRIFELRNAMPHAKTVTIDGIISTLGSANMDQRSFRLNFEANAFFFDADLASDLERDFIWLCSEAVVITAAGRRGISRRQRLTEGLGRVLAPLL